MLNNNVKLIYFSIQIKFFKKSFKDLCIPISWKRKLSNFRPS